MNAIKRMPGKTYYIQSVRTVCPEQSRDRKMRRKRRNMAMSEKPKILIADDSEINRALLKEILGDGYDYLEAEDGAAAVELMRQRTDISLLLLDLMMPGMDGFDVLRVMKYHAWLDEIPVIVISAAEDTANIERAYDLGVTDYIRRPFERIMVLRRVKNILMLYAKQKRLTRLVTDQVYEKEHNSVLMISILSHVVEFRNSESGLHVLHIRTLTDLLLHRLVQKTDRYQLDESDIALISTASALHDIGKIVIPEEILNKPGRVLDARTTDCTRTFICCISRCSATPGLRKARVRGTID
jgi:response regulator RpfG family c-di-GMP phosphodiesterase